MADPEKGSPIDEVAIQLSDMNKRWLEALTEAVGREGILKKRLAECEGILREKVAELERTKGVLRERIVELEGSNSMLRGKLETIVNSKEAGSEEVEFIKQQMIAEKFILIAAVEMLVSGIEGENLLWKEDLAEVARIARSILDLDLREITQVKCMQGMQTKTYKPFCWGASYSNRVASSLNVGYLYSIINTILFQAANLFKKKNKPKGLPTDAAGLKEIVTFYEKNYKQLTGPQKSSPVKKPQVDEEANLVKSPAAKLTNGTTIEVGKLVTKEKAAEVESPKEEEDENRASNSIFQTII